MGDDLKLGSAWMLDGLPMWHTLSDDDLILAFRAEVALPQPQQPVKDCATFELIYRGLVLRRDAPFEAFDGQYRRLIINWLRKTSQAGLVLARLDGNVDDLVTVVYMRIFRSWNKKGQAQFYRKFEGRPAKVFAYLQATCISTVISEARRHVHEALSLDDEVALSSYTTDDWLTNRAAFYQRLRQLLSDEENSIYELHAQGYSAPEIAERLNKPHSYIRRRLKELLTKLADDADLKALFNDSLQ